MAALEAVVFENDAWSVGQVREELAAPERIGTVALVGQEVVGYAITWQSGDSVDLQRIAVSAAHRRHGIATALLAEVSRRACEGGAHQMLLEVSAANTAALRFYAAEGFAEIDRRRRYYRDGADAIVLRRPLTPADAGDGCRPGQGR